MTERDRARDRDLRERDRGRDRDRDRRRVKEERDRDQPRSKRTRSRTPERSLSRHTRSRTLSRSRSPDDRSHRSRRHHHRTTPSPEPARKRHRRESTVEDDDRHKVVSDFVDGIVKAQQQKQKDGGNDCGGVGEEGMVDTDEMETMKMLGIPTGFDTTKGKPVPGADVSGIRAVTKRQPRQYMNRRGGFNRPLPAERNR